MLYIVSTCVLSSLLVHSVTLFPSEKALSLSLVAVGCDRPIVRRHLLPGLLRDLHLLSQRSFLYYHLHPRSDLSLDHGPGDNARHGHERGLLLAQEVLLRTQNRPRPAYPVPRYHDLRRNFVVLHRVTAYQRPRPAQSSLAVNCDRAGLLFGFL